MTNKIIGSIAVVALLVGGYALFNTFQAQPATQPAGAVSGPDVFQKMLFHADFVVGGSNFATTSQGAVTYTAAQMMNNRLITHTAASTLTATLPASTTLGAYLPNVGDSKTTCIDAITTKITLAAGTGDIFSYGTTTSIVGAGNEMCVTFSKKANTDIDVLLF